MFSWVFLFFCIFSVLWPPCYPLFWELKVTSNSRSFCLYLSNVRVADELQGQFVEFWGVDPGLGKHSTVWAISLAYLFVCLGIFETESHVYMGWSHHLGMMRQQDVECEASPSYIAKLQKDYLEEAKKKERKRKLWALFWLIIQSLYK